MQYADCDQITVIDSVSTNDGNFEIVVQDIGADSANAKKGYGLKNTQSRVADPGGMLEVNSTNSSTSVCLTISTPVAATRRESLRK